MIKIIKPQRPQRYTLSAHKEYPFEEINEKIIFCALIIHLS